MSNLFRWGLSPRIVCPVSPSGARFQKRSGLNNKAISLVFVGLTLPLSLFSPAYAADLPPETYYKGINSNVDGDDKVSGALPIGFTFSFFGNNYTSFYVSSNGLILFGKGDTKYNNTTIPNATPPNNYIGAFWDDLTANKSKKAHIYYQTIGTAPNRRLVVQWTDMGFFKRTIPMGTFQSILSEGSNNIQVQFRALLANTARNHGSGATIGLENAKGSAGVSYLYGKDDDASVNKTSVNKTSSVNSGSVILFTPNGGNYRKNNTAPYDGVFLGPWDTPPPVVPVLTGPVKGKKAPLTPEFSWGTTDYADKYRLKVDNDSGLTSPVIDVPDLTTTSYTLGAPLTVNTTYHWAVIASNASGETMSEVWHFTAKDATAFPPGISALISPVQGKTNVVTSPTFSWKAATGADSYQLIVSTKRDLSSPFYDKRDITATSQSVSGLAEGTMYYWAVVAHNKTGDTPSSTRELTVADQLTIAKQAKADAEAKLAVAEAKLVVAKQAQADAEAKLVVAKQAQADAEAKLAVAEQAQADAEAKLADAEAKLAVAEQAQAELQTQLTACEKTKSVLICTNVQGSKSGTTDDAPSYASCPSDYTLMGCECNSSGKRCKAAKPDHANNRCIAYNNAGRTGAYAKATCCKAR